MTSPNWAPCTPRGPGRSRSPSSDPGDTVTLDGKADLKTVPTQGADVQVSIAFPARVGTTNGTRDGDSRVSWTLPAGEVSTMRAEVNYADPSTRSFAGWAGNHGRAGARCRDCRRCDGLDGAQSSTDQARAAAKAPVMMTPATKSPASKQADNRNPKNTTK